MDELDIILFPHCYIGETEVKRALDLFGTLTICQPWFMPSPAVASETSALKVLHPPENLRPPRDFMTLLTEYRSWMKQNRGKGHQPSFSPTDSDEDSYREIMRAIRQTDQQASETEEDQAIKQHLILHLARELEEEGLAANKMLLMAKEAKPPLGEAIGKDGPLRGMLDDLPLADPAPFWDEQRLRQLFWAWFGLFGTQVMNRGPLLTLRPDIIDYAAGLFEGRASAPPEDTGAFIKPGPGKGGPHMTAVHLPRLSDEANPEKDMVLAGLSGKTIILLEG